MPRDRPSRQKVRLYRQLAELRGIQLLHLKLYRLKDPNSSSATLTADVVEDLLEWHARFAGSSAVPQPVEFLDPAFALRPRLLHYR
jgi:tRNA A37 threonylcarbamoyladenosine biosynthesis protein TsaE